MESSYDSSGGVLCTVVVGLDGSDASSAALDWIARMLPAGGVVHAVHSAQPDSDGVDDIASRVASWIRKVGDRGVDVRPTIAPEPPVDALVRTASSTDADVVVVGAHATGRHGPRLVGRTVRSLVNRSDRPVVVVPERLSADAARTSTVVAGIGRGASTRAALRWASAFASEHHTPLSLVRAVERRPFFDGDGLLDAMAYYIEPGAVRQLALTDVADLADEIRRSTDDDLEINWSAVPGAAGPRLVEAASDAALLVLGRGVSAESGHHLPRALAHTIKHAPCPIVIVPPDPDGGGGV